MHRQCQGPREPMLGGKQPILSTVKHYNKYVVGSYLCQSLHRMRRNKCIEE